MWMYTCVCVCVCVCVCMCVCARECTGVSFFEHFSVLECLFVSEYTSFMCPFANTSWCDCAGGLITDFVTVLKMTRKLAFRFYSRSPYRLPDKCESACECVRLRVSE
jgi:hypothetical protein